MPSEGVCLASDAWVAIRVGWCRPLTVCAALLLALDEVGLEEAGHLLGVLESGLYRGVGGGQRRLVAEALADLLTGRVENPCVA
jgi:hypothetical protein